MGYETLSLLSYQPSTLRRGHRFRPYLSYFQVLSRFCVVYSLTRLLA